MGFWASLFFIYFIFKIAGALDRARMRAHAYAHPSARKQLEAIIHPLVAAESARQVAAATAAGRTTVVFDIPLLVESGRWRQKVDRVLAMYEPGAEIAVAFTDHLDDLPLVRRAARSVIVNPDSDSWTAFVSSGASVERLEVAP